MKSSVLGRSLQLLGMASKLAQREVGHSVRKGLSSDVGADLVKTRIEQAKVLAENLSQLKGAAMKAGQLLSIDSSDFFPPEFIEILSKLQESADPVAFEKMRQVLLEDMGSEKLGLIEELEEKAFASASIGQVHRAKYKGKDIVLKIQYPGVAESIDSDLAILKKVAQGFVAVSGRKMALDPLFEEMKTILKNEADYVYELQSMQRFAELMKGHEHFIVPEAIPELSSKRVLAMSYVEGEGLAQWMSTSPSREEKDLVGRKILDLYCHEFFDWGVVQTDPNFGNFKIQRNPSKIVLLDFGATVHYEQDFIAKYRSLLKTFATFDREAILKASMDFGLIDDRESDEAKANFVDFLRSSVEPFFPHLQPFRFKDEDFAKRAQEVGREFTSSLKYSPPPEKIVFLHRKLGGIFNMLRKMDSELNLGPYWQKMVGEEFRLPELNP